MGSDKRENIQRVSSQLSKPFDSFEIVLIAIHVFSLCIGYISIFSSYKYYRMNYEVSDISWKKNIFTFHNSHWIVKVMLSIQVRHLAFVFVYIDILQVINTIVLETRMSKIRRILHYF